MVDARVRLYANKGAGTKSYAKKLSLLGFALAAWSIYSLIRSLWYSWEFRQRHGFGDFPELLSTSLVTVAFFLAVGAAILLRRLASTDPVEGIVRGLARLWIVLGICSLGWTVFVYWDITQSPRWHLHLFGSVISQVAVGVSLVRAAFTIGSIPPLWVLSRWSG